MRAKKANLLPLHFTLIKKRRKLVQSVIIIDMDAEMQRTASGQRQVNFESGIIIVNVSVSNVIPQNWDTTDQIGE